jgi:hypothetical protein
LFVRAVHQNCSPSWNHCLLHFPVFHVI